MSSLGRRREQDSTSPAAPAADTGEAGGALRPAAGWMRLSALLDAKRWVWPVLLLLGYLAQVGLRLFLTHTQNFPSVNADEPSYLVLARVLGGGTVTDMPVRVLIPGGYPLLIAPALAIAKNATSAYHLVMLTNALLNSLYLPLAYLMLRRLRLPSLLAYCFATAAAMLSPVVFYEQFAMADTILGVVMLGWLLGLYGLLAEETTPRRRMFYGAVAGLAAGYAQATHDRGSVVVVLTAVLLLATLVRRWAPRSATLVALGGLAVGVLFARLLAAYLASRFHGVPSSTVGTSLMHSLTDLHVLRRTVARTLGQTWYFVISTWGVGGLGVVLCAVALFRPTVPRVHRLLGAVLLAALFGIMLAAAAALPGDGRVDNYVNARYASALVVPMFAIGAAGLYRLKTRALLTWAAGVAGLVVVCCGMLLALAGSDLRKGWFILWGIPDAAFLAQNWHGLQLLRTTAVALLIFAACVAAAVLARRAVPLLAVGLAVLALLSTVVITKEVVRPYVRERRQTITRLTQVDQVRPSDHLVMDASLNWDILMSQPFQVYTGWTSTKKLKDGEAPPTGATVAVLPLQKGQQPVDTWPDAPAGWSIQLVDPDYGYAIWRNQQ